MPLPYLLYAFLLFNVPTNSQAAAICTQNNCNEYKKLRSYTHTCNPTQYKDNASLTVNRLAVVQLLYVVSLRFRNEMVISLVLCTNCKRKANPLMATTSKKIMLHLFYLTGCLCASLFIYRVWPSEPNSTIWLLQKMAFNNRYKLLTIRCYACVVVKQQQQQKIECQKRT